MVDVVVVEVVEWVGILDLRFEISDFRFEISDFRFEISEMGAMGEMGGGVNAAAATG